MNKYDEDKFHAPDPEDQARAARGLSTPQLAFDKLFDRILQARAKGPVRYDATQLVIETLVLEIASLKGEIASLKSKE